MEIWAEHLNIWIAETQVEVKPDLSGWKIVVDIIKLVVATG